MEMARWFVTYDYKTQQNPTLAGQKEEGDFLLKVS